MTMTKYSYVVAVGPESLTFDDGRVLKSYHDRDCCEWHWLSFGEYSPKDFEGLYFDLSGTFFERVKGYGIRLLPLNGQPIPVPGYDSNNGYYGDNLMLVLLDSDGNMSAQYDITDCQECYKESE